MGVHRKKILMRVVIVLPSAMWEVEINIHFDPLIQYNTIVL